MQQSIVSQRTNWLQNKFPSCPSMQPSKNIQPKIYQQRCSQFFYNDFSLKNQCLSQRQQVTQNAAFSDIISSIPIPQEVLVAIGVAVILFFAIKKILDTPSRTYDENVGDEYDAWTDEGVLEYYWGDHIHLGYYDDAERKKGYLKKDFKIAKIDFIEKMLKWSEVGQPKTVLDVGCGFGGTTRYLAKTFPDAEVNGVTLSPKQVEYGKNASKEQNITNTNYQVMNALEMTWPDNSFDLVWACESAEHMPDKAAYINEMVRVLKPGGTIVIATWCQREEGSSPFTDKDKRDLQYLYDEWAHPFFLSKEGYAQLVEDTSVMSKVSYADWTNVTLPTWLHSIWVGIVDPWIVVFKGPRVWYKTIREIYMIVRMHNAFDRGLMEYGMVKGTKAA